MTDRTNRPKKPGDRQKKPNDMPDNPQTNDVANRPNTKDREEVRKQHTHHYASRKEPSHNDRKDK